MVALNSIDSQGLSKERLNELSKDELIEIIEKHGMSNTVPKQVAENESNSIPFWESEYVKKKKDVSIMFDWVRLYSRDCRLTHKVVEEIVTGVVGGAFFVQGQCHTDLLPVYKKLVGGQLHKGSDRTWTYSYSNALGIEVRVCSSQLNQLTEQQQQSLAVLDLKDIEYDAIQIDLGGTPLSNLVPRNNQLVIAELVWYMKKWGNGKINLSRIDNAIEIPTSYLDLKQLLKDVDNKKIYGAKCYTPILNYNHQTVEKHLKNIVDAEVRKQEMAKWTGSMTGLTVNLGGKSSRKKIRVYNTLEKHGYSATRIEVENHDDRARLIQEELYQIYELYYQEKITAQEANDRIIAFIKDYNLSYKTLHPCDKKPVQTWNGKVYYPREYWAKMMEKIEATPLQYKMDRQKTSIQKSMKWLIDKVSSTLAVLKERFGVNYVFNYVETMIEVSKKGLGCKPLMSNETAKEKLNKLELLKHDELFFPQDLKRLKEAGYYDRMRYGYRPKTNYHRYLIRNNTFNIDPRYYRSSMVEIPF